MKEIIKKAEEDKKIYVKKCGYCKCKFIYTKDVVIFGSLFDYIYCPSCMQFLTIIKYKTYKRN